MALRERILHVFKQYPDPRVGYLTATVVAVQGEGHAVYSPAFILAVQAPMRQDRLLGMALTMVPEPGVRTKYDRLVPWAARVVSRWLKTGVDPDEAEVVDAFIDGVPATGAAIEGLRATISYVADWFQHARGVDIMRLSLAEAVSRAAAWHDEQAEKGTEAAAVAGTIVFEYGDGWTVQALTTAEQLRAEGESMGHCVGGYCEAVARKSTAILSIRDLEGVPHVTLELDRNQRHVAQIKGRGNKPPEKKDLCRRVSALFSRWPGRKPYSVELDENNCVESWPLYTTPDPARFPEYTNRDAEGRLLMDWDSTEESRRLQYREDSKNDLFGARGLAVAPALPKTLEPFRASIASISIERDDGRPDYWVYLRRGLCAGDDGLHTVHESSLRAVARVLRTEVRACACADCFDRALGGRRGWR